MERDVSDAMLMEVIDEGETRYRDETHLWALMEFPERHDNLLCAVAVLDDALIVKIVMHHLLHRCKESAMRATYCDEDDIRVIHLSDKPICRDVSQDWNTHISYAEDGSTVEVVLLEAKASGAFPFKIEHAPAA